MRVPFTPKPKTLADRAKVVADDAIEFARSVPERIAEPRERALAVVGAVAGVAAGLAFWRSRSDNDPSVHHDPAPAPWKMAPPHERPSQVSDAPDPSLVDAAAEAAGSRSK
jgi:hypothetical protein